jgi:hypothetical protein
MEAEIKNFSATFGMGKTPDGREIKSISVRIWDESGVVVETSAVLPFQEYTSLELQEQSFKVALIEALERAFQVMKDKSNILPRFT